MLVKHFSFLCTGVHHARLTSGLPSRSTCVLADLACDFVVCGCGDPVHSGDPVHQVWRTIRLLTHHERTLCCTCELNCGPSLSVQLQHSVELVYSIIAVSFSELRLLRFACAHQLFAERGNILPMAISDQAHCSVPQLQPGMALPRPLAQHAANRLGDHLLPVGRPELRQNCRPQHALPHLRPLDGPAVTKTYNRQRRCLRAR